MKQSKYTCVILDANGVLLDGDSQFAFFGVLATVHQMFRRLSMMSRYNLTTTLNWLGLNGRGEGGFDVTTTFGSGDMVPRKSMDRCQLRSRRECSLASCTIPRICPSVGARVRTFCSIRIPVSMCADNSDPSASGSLTGC